MNQNTKVLTYTTHFLQEMLKHSPHLNHFSDLNGHHILKLCFKSCSQDQLKIQQAQKQTEYLSWDRLEISATSKPNFIYNLEKQCLAEQKYLRFKM